MQGAYQGWAIGKMDEKYAARSNNQAYGGDGGKTIFFIRPVFDGTDDMKKTCPCDFDDGWYFHPDISKLDKQHWLKDKNGVKYQVNPNLNHPIYVKDLIDDHPMGQKQYNWKLKERFLII